MNHREGRAPAADESHLAPRRPHRCDAVNRHYRAVIHPTIAEVDPDAWDRVVGGGTLFLQRRFLAAVEAGGAATLLFRYAQFFAGDQPVGVACFQRTEFISEPLGPLLAERTPAVAAVAKRLRLLQEPFSLGLWVCGSAFSAGEHGFLFLPGADSEQAICSVVGVVEALQAEGGGDAQVSGVLFKELYPRSAPLGRWLTRHDFALLPSEPNMILTLESGWQSFDDYLAALSSKFRVKAKRAYAKSEALTVRPLDIEAVARFGDRMRALLSAVLERAEHRLRCPGVGGLVELRRALGPDLILDGYFLGDELVGFASALVDGDALEAHLVGFDYAHNLEHAIYPRILYDYVRRAIELGSARLNFGRTASEIKSTVGAVPVDLTCWARHRNGAVNRLLPAVARAIRPADFPLRRPFKRDRNGSQNGNGNGGGGPAVDDGEDAGT